MTKIIAVQLFIVDNTCQSDKKRKIMLDQDKIFYEKFVRICIHNLTAHSDNFARTCSNQLTENMSKRNNLFIMYALLEFCSKILTTGH